MRPQRVLVTGASGYIGGRLVPELLDAGYEVRCLARTPAKLDDADWRDRVDVAEGDVTDPEELRAAMADVDAAYYLVHSMGGSSTFEQHDREAAGIFRDAAADAGLARIVYLGGLGRDDDPTLSRHLQSRHEVGRVLAEGTVPVTELRAAVIIGSGSASFEMLRSLVDVLPVMVAPRWVENRCQPIAVRDVLTYLVAVLDADDAAGRVLEIGGPDVLTYAEMMQTYAECAGLRRRGIVRVPILSPKLSSLWIGLVTPLPSGLGRPLVESLINEVVVTDRPIGAVVDHEPMPFRAALDLALRRVADRNVLTRWSDAALPGTTPADPLPTDPSWSGGRVLSDVQETTADASVHALFRTVEGIGGGRGWYTTSLLWSIRGVADKLVGGVGMRRGRRDPDRMWVGDAVDFWRVEAVQPDELIRLRAEMKLPGEAWLEWTMVPADPGDRGPRTTLHQRAIFHPKGVVGRAYWYALVPFHGLIFKQLCRRLADAAERVEHEGVRPAEAAPGAAEPV